MIAKYLEISSLATESRKDFYSQSLSDDMKDDLWSLQFEYCLIDHPELTAEQRSIIFETLGFIQSGALHVHVGSPDRHARVELPIQHLAERLSQSAFPNARETFAHLGYPDPFSVSQVPAQSARGKLRTTKPDLGNLPPCECSSEPNQDFCCVLDCLTSGTPKCISVPHTCLRTPDGCGWLWQSACNGYCGG